MSKKKAVVKIVEPLRIRIAKQKWGEDFSDLPYSGCVHTVYNDVAGQITLSSIVCPFTEEEKATAIQLSWLEFVEMEIEKSVCRKWTVKQRSRSVEFPIKNGLVDMEAVMKAIDEAMIQVGRNRMILDLLGSCK